MHRTSRSRRSSRKSRSPLQKRSPERVLAANVEYYSAVVLDVAEIPPPLAPAMFACSRVARWSAHPRAEAHRPAVPAVGALRRSDSALTAAPRDAHRGCRTGRSPCACRRRARPGHLRGEWADEIEAAARDHDYRVAAAPIARSRSSPQRETELLRRGLEDEPGGARLLAQSRSRRSRAAIPGTSARFRRPLLHELAARDPNVAVRRLAIVCLKNGSPQPDTVRLLNRLAESDERDYEVRKTARVVADALAKQSRTRKWALRSSA